MSQSLAKSVSDLRTALLKLNSTGPKGFEGLLAHVLSKITSKDFRLAISGSQAGKDGEALASPNHIAFEAKLYKNPIPATEVANKITQLIGTTTPPDLWVLGATVEASTQALAPTYTAALKNGIVILLLDWPASSVIPPLAAACALAQDETYGFLQENVAPKAVVTKARAALRAIASAPEFKDAAAALERTLRDPTIGVALARPANRDWLEIAFSDKRVARSMFGQALAPRANFALRARPRPGLIDTIQRHIMKPPPDNVIALVGGDGFGKSWLFAQSWLELEDKPLTIVVPAATIKPTDACTTTLLPGFISHLIQQTNTSNTEEIRQRWQRRFRQWKEQANPPRPRFVVYVDGLNEQKGVDWGRWIDSAQAVIQDHGGVLIVSVRKAFFHERLRMALHSSITRVEVPEWSQGELREILTTEGIDLEKIKPDVMSRLRNPRILGIAFELKGKVQIHHFSELTVERLLFEHIRLGEFGGTAPEPPTEFVRRLAQHAQAILKRVEAQKREGRLLFDRARENDNGYELSSDLLAVAGENYFTPLPEEPTVYQLSEKGLTLALGFAILRSLKLAAHDERDVEEVLEQILEPVAALDKTAEAIFAALLVSSADDDCPSVIRKTLVISFLSLQNVDTDTYYPFISVVRKIPDEALDALAEFSTTRNYAPYKNWLLAALRACRANSDCWDTISKHVSQWLRVYSLDPKLSVLGIHAHEDADKVAQETERRTKELNERVNAMSPGEREFLTKHMLRDDERDPANLALDALTLLAGRDLASFARDLVACAYSVQLNASHHKPYDEYIALLRFNRKDWIATRHAMLTASTFLSDANASRTAKWTLVTVLHGLSAPEDAAQADDLVDALNKDRERLGGWRLVERYCATDPCDPISPRPDNIDQTAQQYRKINVADVASQRSMGEQDHFAREALAGVARFEPEAAVATRRAMAEAFVARDGHRLMLGIISLEQDTAVLNKSTAGKLVALAHSISAPRGPEGDPKSRDDWISAQYALQAAFPHLNGDDQLDVLIALPPHGPPLLKLADVVKQASANKLEQVLEHALSSTDHSRQLLALMFASHSGTELTLRSRAVVAELARNDRSSVRAEALNVLAQLKDPEFIRPLIDDGYSAATLDRREQHFEAWHGSSLLIAAGVLKLITIDEVLDRIIPERYGFAAQTLGESSYASVVTRLQVAVEKATEATIPFGPPVVEQYAETDPREPPLWSLAEPDEVLGADAFFKRLAETPDDFDARQRQGWRAFNDFVATVSKSDARLIIENVGIAVIRIFVETASNAATGLGQAILTMESSKLRQIANFALMLAQCLSVDHPALAYRMFDRLDGQRPFVNLHYGYSAVGLAALSIWSSSDCPEMDALRQRRLDDAATDHAISQEVSAALMAKKTAFLDKYVRANLEKPGPAATARALMVVGFGAQSPEAAAILARHANIGGLVGQAYKAARFAYDRDAWSRHWFDRMCQAASGEEYWRHSTLFLKVVDSRFSEWESEVKRGPIAITFQPTIEDALEKRAKAWKRKREKTLCGDAAPSEVFVVIDA